MYKVPILLVVFNRPDYTQKIFDQVREIAPTQLFIAADGPRPDRPDDLDKTNRVRDIVSKVDWPCEVHKLFRDKNIGFRDAERFAFDWFFEHVEAGVILEDDELPNQSFFRFAEEMLERYKDNKEVMMITGSNPMSDPEMKDSYFFSKYFSIWGWASWRRAWKQYDFDMKSWGEKNNKIKIKNIFSQKFMQGRLKKMFDEIYPGPPKTWDTQWMYACLMNNGVCIVPKVNLITNIGIEGVHSQGGNQNLQSYDIYQYGRLTHPQAIAVNTDYDNAFFEKNFKEPKRPLHIRLKRGLISILVRYEWIKKIYRALLGRK